MGELSCGLRRDASDIKNRLLSARKLDLAIQWLRLHEFVYKIASWDELIELRSSVEFGLVSSATADGNLTVGLKLAILAARNSPRFRLALTYAQAVDNVAVVADQIAALELSAVLP
jgi:hypothetical protein